MVQASTRNAACQTARALTLKGNIRSQSRCLDHSQQTLASKCVQPSWNGARRAASAKRRPRRGAVDWHLLIGTRCTHKHTHAKQNRCRNNIFKICARVACRLRKSVHAQDDFGFAHGRRPHIFESCNTLSGTEGSTCRSGPSSAQPPLANERQASIGEHGAARAQ